MDNAISSFEAQATARILPNDYLAESELIFSPRYAEISRDMAETA